MYYLIYFLHKESKQKQKVQGRDLDFYSQETSPVTFGEFTWQVI